MVKGEKNSGAGKRGRRVFFSGTVIISVSSFPCPLLIVLNEMGYAVEYSEHEKGKIHPRLNP